MPARGSYSVGRIRRAKIVAAAAQHFAQRGYQGATLTAIAAAAGVTDAGLSHHFKDKEQLLLAVLEERQAKTIESLTGEQARTAKGIISSLIRGAERALDDPQQIELLVILTAEAANPAHPHHQFMADRYDQIRGLIAGRLRVDADAGVIKPDTDAEAVAAQCLALSDGLRLQWVLSHRGFDLSKRLHDALDRLCRTITTDGSGL